MSLTVYNQAQYYFTLYELTNSDTYKNNKVDASAVSEESYNISNLTNAIDTMESAYSVDLSSVGNADSYVNNLYTVSQLDMYDLLGDSGSDSSLSDFLSGETDLSGMYDLIAPDTDANTAFLESVIAANSDTDSDTETASASSSSLESYSKYLSESLTGSLLDTTL